MSDQAQKLREIVSTSKKDVANRRMKIITITSGKGGVGKSSFTANLSICIKEQNKNPVILDADFGLANIEIIFGERPKYNLLSMIHNECNLKELITPTKYDVPFISGGSGIKDMLFLSKSQIESIGDSLQELEEEADILLIDTGAGINDIVLKFSMIADEVYVVVTSDPSSITDAYALIKTLTKDFNMCPRFKIVINKASSKQEAHEVFTKLSYAAKYFLKNELEYAGFIPYDEKLMMANKKQVPIVAYDRKARASNAYYEISKLILQEGTYFDTDQEEKGSWISRFKKIFSSN